ncbi:hypothetical protein DFP73DRAFT_596024 [Morchella snyderi]|nr:hypothetical protein DFP73DRAFT_596024 [Morchella snyderi]
MQAQRIEKECSTLIGDHTFLHEPFPPAVRLSVLIVSMWAAASRRVGCTVDLDRVVIKQVRSLHSRVRSHLMHKVKGRLADSTIYGLGNLSGPEARAAQAEYLLQNDRFLSPAQHYETYRLRFLAPEIIDILYYKYFDGVRIRGVKDPEFLERITPTFLCLISTVIWHGIRPWSTGIYVKPDHFQLQNENVVKTFNRMSNTWKGRSRQNQEAMLEVIKDNLREKIREKKGITIQVIPEDGFSEDDEALAADLAAFRNARKAPPSAPVDPSGSDNGGGQEEVVHAQLRGIEAEGEGEENEEEQEEGDNERGEEEEDASALESTGSALEASALKSTGSASEASALESTGSALEASALESTGEYFGEHKRVLWSVSSMPTKAKSSMPAKNRGLNGKTRCIGVRQLQQAISGAAGERQARERFVEIASGERAFRRGERITIEAREKPSIRLGALGTLVRARAECFTPERDRSILLLLWRGSLSTKHPGHPERPQRLAEAPGLLMQAANTAPYGHPQTANTAAIRHRILHHLDTPRQRTDTYQSSNTCNGMPRLKEKFGKEKD